IGKFSKFIAPCVRSGYSNHTIVHGSPQKKRREAHAVQEPRGTIERQGLSRRLQHRTSFARDFLQVLEGVRVVGQFFGTKGGVALKEAIGFESVETEELPDFNVSESASACEVAIWLSKSPPTMAARSRFEFR